MIQMSPTAQEVLESQQATSSGDHHKVDIDDLLDDPELERLHAERLYALQKEVEKRAALQRKGHGELQEVEEGQFLQVCRNPSAHAQVALFVSAFFAILTFLPTARASEIHFYRNTMEGCAEDDILW